MPTTSDDEREQAVATAALCIQRGELVVIPTDTVYGIAADAFDADAVEELLEAKGRGREMPPPVLVSSPTTLDALAVRVPAYARALVERFWPGALTLVCHQQTSLKWDLGDTRGTVAIRMPDHPVALEVLERTGPLAVSSANLTGRPAALDAETAEDMLGEEVAVIVDAGPSLGGEASTIVDATGPTPRILRLGALGLDDLDVVLAPLGLSLGSGPAKAVDLDKTPADEEPSQTEEPPAAAASTRKTAARKTAAAKKTTAVKKTTATKKTTAVKKATAAKKTTATRKPAAKRTTATTKPAATRTTPAKSTPAKKPPAPDA